MSLAAHRLIALQRCAPWTGRRTLGHQHQTHAFHAHHPAPSRAATSASALREKILLDLVLKNEGEPTESTPRPPRASNSLRLGICPQTGKPLYIDAQEVLENAIDRGAKTPRWSTRTFREVRPVNGRTPLTDAQLRNLSDHPLPIHYLSSTATMTLQHPRARLYHLLAQPSEWRNVLGRPPSKMIFTDASGIGHILEPVANLEDTVLTFRVPHKKTVPWDPLAGKPRGDRILTLIPRKGGPDNPAVLPFHSSDDSAQSTVCAQLQTDSWLSSRPRPPQNPNDLNAFSNSSTIFLASQGFGKLSLFGVNWTLRDVDSAGDRSRWSKGRTEVTLEMNLETVDKHLVTDVEWAWRKSFHSIMLRLEGRVHHYDVNQFQRELGDVLTETYDRRRPYDWYADLRNLEAWRASQKRLEEHNASPDVPAPSDRFPYDEIHELYCRPDAPPQASPSSGSEDSPGGDVENDTTKTMFNGPFFRDEQRKARNSQLRHALSHTESHGHISTPSAPWKTKPPDKILRTSRTREEIERGLVVATGDDRPHVAELSPGQSSRSDLSELLKRYEALRARAAALGQEPS